MGKQARKEGQKDRQTDGLVNAIYKCPVYRGTGASTGPCICKSGKTIPLGC